MCFDETILPNASDQIFNLLIALVAVALLNIGYPPPETISNYFFLKSVNILLDFDVENRYKKKRLVRAIVTQPTQRK